MKKTIPYNLLFIRLFTLFLFTSSINAAFSQNHQLRYKALDVLHYKFEIALNDTTDVIKASASLTIAFKQIQSTFVLDLKALNKEGLGMIVDEITEGNTKIDFTHQNDQIRLFITPTKAGEKRIYSINYHGIPDDGLIISNNKFGDRVFFGDNWPNRAHHWLPTVDHPSDKATVEFIVTAPSHYQVVANGLNLEETNTGNLIISHWKTTVPLSTKLMVIGVARFAKQKLIEANTLDVSSWVYPQNREAGFLDYKIALKPLEFFSTHIAPFPFAKLANVQSKTIYGGMENAGCIFYAERSVNGKNEQENLFAHEIAHQWFGDAISEMNWHHVWLSEGFATYFTGLYIENQHGKKAFTEWLINQKKKVLDYSNEHLAPVIDTTLEVSVDLLNANSYQKGAWFLHMLRKELGDDLFWKSIRAYYQKYKFKNVLTKDFQAVVEAESGEDLNLFFDQWLYTSGHPILSYNWTFAKKKIQFELNQQQGLSTFEFPLDLLLVFEDGSFSSETVYVKKAHEVFKIRSKKQPKEIILDPDSWLLFELLRVD